jgi:release factor glutamine methyltransferase
MKKIEDYLEFIDTRRPDTDANSEIIQDLILDIDAGVWSPSKGKSTKMFLEILENYPLDDIRSVLDIGTGCGILALYLYKKGIKNITATDYMDEAINNAKKNLENNNACEIKLKKTDLFLGIEGKFDLILFNAPATHPKRRQISRLLEPLWSKEENIRLRFFEHLDNFLTPNGKALLMYSKFNDYDPIPNEVLKRFPFSYETLKNSTGDLSESGIIEVKFRK